jgi:hypothetical protein
VAVVLKALHTLLTFFGCVLTIKVNALFPIEIIGWLQLLFYRMKKKRERERKCG